MFWAVMMRSSWLRGSTLAICIVGLFWVQAEGTRAEGPGSIEFGQFSSALASETLPKGWEPLTFKKIPRHTLYSLVKDKEGTVVKAVSEAASSGLAKEMSVNPREYPFIEWKWNAKNLLQKGDVSRKDGDDSPARLYVTFAFDRSRVNVFKRVLYEAIKLIYGRYPPLGAVNYIWDSRAPVGTMLPNAYTDQVMMFVLENSPARLNMWITEQRNVYEDYKRAFGQEPPMISGVAIMTDTDNTGESAEALYGDIIFLKAAR